MLRDVAFTVNVNCGSSTARNARRRFNSTEYVNASNLDKVPQTNSYKAEDWKGGRYFSPTVLSDKELKLEMKELFEEVG